MKNKSANKCRGCDLKQSKKGITLIALIITIIVMLILVAVTVNVAINGGLFGKADEASKGTEEEAIYDQIVSAMVLEDKGKLNVSSTAEAAIADLKGKGYTVSPEEVSKEVSEVTLTVTGKKGTYKYLIAEEEIKIFEKGGNQEEISYMEALENGWVYVTEKSSKNGDKNYMLLLGGDIENFELNNTTGTIIEKVPCFEVEDDIYNLDSAKFKGYNDIDLVGDVYIYLGDNPTIKTVDFGNYAVKLDTGCFGGSSITNITGMGGLSEIPNDCFCNCLGLTSITIPSNITSLGGYMFEGCENLQSIVIQKSEGSISGSPWSAPVTTTITWEPQ